MMAHGATPSGRIYHKAEKQKNAPLPNYTRIKEIRAKELDLGYKIIIDGKVYKTLRSAAEAVGCTPKRLEYALDKNMHTYAGHKIKRTKN